METKHTKEYAEKFALQEFPEKNFGLIDLEISMQSSRISFKKGYMKAIEENKVPEVLQSLVNLQKRLELLILCTPSGKERNRMTDENMFALSLINELS